MNSHLLIKAFRQQYRKRALRISVGVPNHKRLAADTRGTWHAIPVDTIPQNAP